MRCVRVKTIMRCFLALVIMAALAVGCGEDDKEQKTTITIGHLTDYTGPASSALIDLTWALEDLVRYINEEDPVPGVELRLANYDSRYDPARDIPGYEWCRGKGAEVIFTALPTSAEVLKLFAEKDKIPVAAVSTTRTMIEPPGWVFCFHTPASWEARGLLKWVGEQWNGYPTKPKIGAVGWREPWQIDLTAGVKDYCETHADQFEWVDGLFAPMGVMTWSGETEKLKECDYIVTPSTGMGAGSFMREYRNKGYNAVFLNVDGISAFYDILVDMVGWEGLDGTLNAQAWNWWGSPNPMIQLLEKLCQENHPNEYDEIKRRGCGYIGGSEAYLFLQVLRQAIEEVGPENFDGQAFYDTAVSFTTKWEGYPEMGFGPTRRWAVEYAKVWEWSASARDLVEVSDWIPVIP